VQQIEHHRQDHQQDDRQQAAAEHRIDDRALIDQVLAQHLDRLRRRAGTDDHGDQDGDPRGVEDQALDVDPAALANGGMAGLIDRFGAAHERIHGFRLDQPVELVNLRAVGTGRVVKIDFPRFDDSGPESRDAVVDQRRVYFDGNFVTANIYDRALLSAGNEIPGPAVITQRDSTTVIHPGHVGRVDGVLNILITPVGGRA